MNSSLLFPETASVWINGEKIGAVKGWSSSFQRQLYAVESMEEQEPCALLPYAPRYRITLDRLSAAAANLSSLHNFRILFKDSKKTVLFTQCEWVEIQEESSAAGMGWVRAVAEAKNREEETA